MTTDQLQSLAVLIRDRTGTDADLAAALSADVTTHRPIPLSSLHGSGILGHDRKLLMDIFAKSVSQR